MTRGGSAWVATVVRSGFISRSWTLVAEMQVVTSRPCLSKAIVIPQEPIPPMPS